MRKIWTVAIVLGLSLSLFACTNDAPSNDQIAALVNEHVFSPSELAQYTGANGSLAYIAVNGIVYDVTNVFDNGKHQGLQLGGTDATTVFAVSPHSQGLLATLPVVGVYDPNQTINNPTNPQDPATPTESTLPVFTLTELSAFTGANGSIAYIAVNGVIYDVTNVFVNGKHQGLQLGGTDATQAFASSPHSASLLATLPVVGSLEGYPAITEPTTPTYPYDDDDDDEYDDDDDDEYEDEDDDDDDYEHEDEDEDEYEDD